MDEVLVLQHHTNSITTPHYYTQYRNLLFPSEIHYWLFPDKRI